MDNWFFETVTRATMGRLVARPSQVRYIGGATTPPPMAVTQAEIAALIANDREEAHEDACDALYAIEALQSTATWQVLPLSVRRQLCASHALLGGIADELAGA